MHRRFSFSVRYPNPKGELINCQDFLGRLPTYWAEYFLGNILGKARHGFSIRDRVHISAGPETQQLERDKPVRPPEGGPNGRDWMDGLPLSYRLRVGCFASTVLLDHELDANVAGYDSRHF